MDDVIIEDVTKENEETEVQTSEAETQNVETAEDVPGFEETDSFAPPTIMIEGVTYSYYELAYREQIRSNALIMTILIAIVSIFALTRFYRWFRSIFTIRI